MKSTGDTRFAELATPNGMVAGPGALCVQAGVDILENGGTAADACVAAAAVVAVMARQRSSIVSITVLVQCGGERPAIALDVLNGDASSVVAGWHALVNRCGNRSLYDLSRGAFRYSEMADRLQARTYANQRVRTGEPSSVRAALRGAEGVNRSDEGRMWRPAHRTEAAGLTWIEAAPAAFAGVTSMSPRSQCEYPAGAMETDMLESLQQTHRVSTMHVAAVDHWGMVVSLVIVDGMLDRGYRQSRHEAFHTIVLRDGRALLVAGETGSGRSQVLKQFLDNHLVLGMGVQSAVEATRTSASDKSQALPEVGHRRQVPGTLQQEGRTVTSGLWPTTIQDRVGAIAIDRRHGLLIGGQDAERGCSIAGY